MFLNGWKLSLSPTLKTQTWYNLFGKISYAGSIAKGSSVRHWVSIHYSKIFAINGRLTFGILLRSIRRGMGSSSYQQNNFEHIEDASGGGQREVGRGAACGALVLSGLPSENL